MKHIRSAPRLWPSKGSKASKQVFMLSRFLTKLKPLGTTLANSLCAPFPNPSSPPSPAPPTASP